MATIIDCNFSIVDYDEFYCCSIEHEIIPEKVKELKLKGVHHPGKSDEDVFKLQITDSILPRMPHHFVNIYKNLRSLNIGQSNLSSITKFELKFEHLRSIYLHENDLEYLPGDLFEFTKNLELVFLHNNKIKFIGPKLLDDLQCLREVKFDGNVSIDCSFIRNVFGVVPKKVSLDQLKFMISKCTPPLSEPEMIKKYRNQPKPSTSSASKVIGVKPNGFNDDLQKFLALDDFKDCTLKIDGREFKIHKLIFAARSERFAEMIKANPDDNVFRLDDISVKTFECVLDYVYTDKPPKTQNLIEVFLAAGLLKIKGLKNITAGLLLLSLNNEKNLMNLFKIYQLAHSFEHGKMKLKAFEEIEKQIPGIKFMEEPGKLKKIIEAKLGCGRKV